jgi:hypothetical protein
MDFPRGRGAHGNNGSGDWFVPVVDVVKRPSEGFALDCGLLGRPRHIFACICLKPDDGGPLHSLRNMGYEHRQVRQ